MNTEHLKTNILQSFHMKGLYGYKNLGIRCNNKASIILAENGVGKTTLLNTLYALLSGRISRLKTLDFVEAVLKFDDKELIFSKALAFQKLEKNDYAKLLSRRPARELLEYGVTSDQLLELLTIHNEGNRQLLLRHPAYRRLYQTSPYDSDDLLTKFDRLNNAMYDTVYIADFRKKVIEAMGETQVLYLPTYRRIEADFDEVSLSRNTPNRRITSDLAEKESENDQLIFFGLTDVEEKLSQMTGFIQRSMFEAYSKLSGNLIDTLLGTPQYELPISETFDLEAVRLMLGRLGKSNSTTADELEKAIAGAKLSDDKYRPLAYFLQQLMQSYEASRPQELAIEEFVRVVNGYLEGASTEKSLKFDKLRLKVEVWHRALERDLLFKSLSSGEKQVVSVFSRLILDTNKKYLILIDEPELSLSIEWQRRFLPDILKTKSCHQLVAITHSPFVFDNELDLLAQSIGITLDEVNRSNG
jgi:predicted ATP-dependent endonuclease of OLD family